MNISLIGYVAGILITIALIPQLIRSWKTKSTKDLSLWRYILQATGTFLWLIYGIFLKSWPLVITNIVLLSLIFSIMSLKIKYGLPQYEIKTIKMEG